MRKRIEGIPSSFLLECSNSELAVTVSKNSSIPVLILVELWRLNTSLLDLYRKDNFMFTCEFD